MMKYGARIAVGIMIMTVLLATGCGEGSGTDKDIDVAFTALSADGSSEEATTTKLTLTFNKDIDGLAATDITLEPGTTGASRNNLTKAAGQTGVYELTLKNISAGGVVTVSSIEKPGYIITGAPKTAEVYYYTSSSNSKADIEAFIEEHWEEYGYSAKPDKYIALSFDDGPCAPGDSGGTTAMLAELERLNVKATFFVIGQNIRNNQSAAKAIFNAGHELANHSDGYGGLGGTTAEATITTSLEAASAEIKKITGADPVLFRAPNVAYGNNLTKVCTEMGLAIIGVSVWSNDYQSITTEQIITNVVNNASLADGAIINCHESNTSGGRTLAALPQMIAGLREKGFWIMTVGELAIVQEKPLAAGTQYDTIK